MSTTSQSQQQGTDAGGRSGQSSVNAAAGAPYSNSTIPQVPSQTSAPGVSKPGIGAVASGSSSVPGGIGKGKGTAPQPTHPPLSIPALTDPTPSTSNPADDVRRDAGSSNSKKRKASPTPTGLAPSRKDRLQSIGVGDDFTDDDGQSASSGMPRKESKRTRVHFSCIECHRRKQKCDRKEPCSQCLTRRVPHLCKPFLNGVEDPANADVQTRLSTIESLLSRLVTSLPSSLARIVDPSSSGGDLDSLLVSQQGEDVFHPKSAEPSSHTGAPVVNSGSMADGPDVPKTLITHKPAPSGLFPAGVTPTNLSSTPSGRAGYGWGLREGRLISLVPEENTDLNDVLSTLKESGVSKNHLEWLIAGVPGRRMADGLVELYFRDIDWTRYKIDKLSFLRKYETFFDSIGRNPTNPKVDGDTLRWLPLMYIVLAIATLSAPHEVIPSADQAAWSRRFYGSARSSLEYAKALQRDNLDVLFAGLLASRYMLLTRRPAEGSTPLTTAFQLGLYRDGTVLNMTDKKEVEIRRRAWAMLYHLDRTVSLLVGRPASISDAHTDTKPPANLDDEDLEGDFDAAGHPMDRPTVYTYIVVRHKLAEIMGRIAYHTFAIQLPDYQKVLELDKELIAWRDSLPAFFHMTKPDLSHDKTHSYLFVQRHLLACEWYYTRITLNRPYLLRRKPQDSRYAYSKDAAIESATADLLSRRAFMMEKGNLIVNSGGYRVLNSYMVLGVTIKLDPESAQADKLRHLLNVVSGRAPDSQGRTSEPLVKEELAIVEFLTAKTNAAAASSSGPAGSSGSSKARATGAKGGKEETPVDLLLGLAKTRSGRRAAEEEQRQLRLQAFREQEEQRNAARGGSSSSGRQQQQQQSQSPWGYQPPSMPGLDVQQPFGSDGSRRQPRPLQPPPSRNRIQLEQPFGSSGQAPQTLAQAAAAATAMADSDHAMSTSVSHVRQPSFGSMSGQSYMSQSQMQHGRTISSGGGAGGSSNQNNNGGGGGLAWPESFDGMDLNLQRPASAHSTHHTQNPQPMGGNSDNHNNRMNSFDFDYGSMHPPHTGNSGGFPSGNTNTTTTTASGGGNMASPNTGNQYPSPMGSGSVNGSTTGHVGAGSGANETLYMQPHQSHSHSHGHGHGGQGQSQHQQHPFQLSPFNSMSALPGNGSGTGHTPGSSGTGGGGGQEYGLEQFIQSMQGGGMGQQQQGQFGSTVPGLEGFDFGDLDLGLGGGDGVGGFNPFALQQTEEGGMPSGDDETQFLNYILTKFANSQPEGQ